MNKVPKSRFNSRDHDSPDSLTAFKEMTASVYQADSFDDENQCKLIKVTTDMPN